MTELVQNGNFDNPPYPDAWSYGPIDNWIRLNGSNSARFNAGLAWAPQPMPTTNINSFFIQFFYSSGLAQDIAIPAGHYTFSFWIAKGTNTPNAPIFNISLSLGSVINQNVYGETKWKKYTIPFFVNTSRTMTLQILNSTANGFLSTIIFHNFSIVPVNFDYTLDLFLEWIPDEEEEKHRKNKRLM